MSSFIHRWADFVGVPASVLRDPSALGGLVVAAAGAAGLSSVAAPSVRQRVSGGVTAFLILESEGCHLAAHSFPDQGLLLVDLLVPSTRNPEPAIDVFTRKLGAAEVRGGSTQR